jgi:hypothetical protein
MTTTMEPLRNFELPDEVAEWDDRGYFAFLQDHQFAYQAKLDELKAKGQGDTDEYRHWLAQFERVEMHMAGDFNRRYYQG